MHTHCRSCDTELTNDNTYKSIKHICKDCHKKDQNLNRNPKSNAKHNPNHRRLKGKYARRKEHPDLYKLFPPGNYTITKEGWYLSLSDSSAEKDQRNKEGNVYIAVNPAWPDMLKIGMTDDLEKRLSGLNTGVPYRDTTYAYTVEVKDMQKAEKLAHRLAEDVCSFRFNEWFRMPVDKAMKILDSLEDDQVKLIQGDFWPDTIIA
jgi:hypothetical protein